MRFITKTVRSFVGNVQIFPWNENIGKSQKMTSWHAQNHFLPVGLKFNLASVKNNHSYEKSIFNVSLDVWCATSPAVQQHRTRQYMSKQRLSVLRQIYRSVKRQTEAVRTECLLEKLYKLWFPHSAAVLRMFILWHSFLMSRPWSLRIVWLLRN